MVHSIIAKRRGVVKPQAYWQAEEVAVFFFRAIRTAYFRMGLFISPPAASQSLMKL